jgi:hypothetical protein
LISINSVKLLTELNGPHYTELENLNLNLDFEFQHLLGSLKHVINIIIRIRDMGCYRVLGGLVVANTSDKTSVGTL